MRDTNDIETDESHDFDVPSQTAPIPSQSVAAETASAPAPSPAATAPEVETLPTDLKAALALLRETDEMPTRDARETAAKEARMQVVRAHWFNLQQGLPVIHVGGDSLASTGRALTEASQIKHMQDLSLVDPVVKEFFESYQSLKAFVERTRK